MKRIIREGEALPFGYGYVREDLMWDGKEVAPVPLNILVRLVYWLMGAVRPSAYERQLRQRLSTAHSYWHDEGEKAGYDKGYKAGYAQAKADLLKRLDSQKEVM